MNASKKGVSLLELMVAMVAASAILGGAGVIYMTALSSFVSAEAVGKVSSSRAMLDEVLTRIGHQSFPGDIVCQSTSIVTYVRARRLDPAFIVQGVVANYPVMSSNAALVAPERVSGIVFWFRGDDGAGTQLKAGATASQIFHLELSQENFQICGNAGAFSSSLMGAGTYFTGMSRADVDSFVGLTVGSDNAVKRGRRLACNLLASNVAMFEVLKGDNAEAIRWNIDFGTSPL